MKLLCTWCGNEGPEVTSLKDFGVWKCDECTNVEKEDIDENPEEKL